MSTTVKYLITAGHLATFYYGFQLQRNDKQLSDINTIGFSIYCSRGAALCLAFDMALILLPVCRKLLSYIARIVSLLFLGARGQGTISEGVHSNMMVYHKFIAYHILAFTTIHVLGHCVNFYRLEQLGRGSAMSYHLGTWAGVTGYWMLLLLGAMFVTAHHKIRKANYEVFWFTHHLAILAMGFFTFHGYGCFVKTNEGQCRGYGSWKYIVLASVIYLIERGLRAFESSRAISLSSAIAHPGGAIELNFKDPTIHYRPGQHVYLNIPQLSRWEWHPFTITSSPIEEFISLDIRQDGDWTGQLGNLLGHGRHKPPLDQAQVVQDRSLLPLIRVDGPYGGPKEDVLNFDHAVLIGTGNGITTFSGILRHIWFRHQETQSSRLQTLDLYWVSRDADKLDWFKSLFSMEKTVELFRTGLIRIHIYFTSTKTLQKQHPSKSFTTRGQDRATTQRTSTRSFSEVGSHSLNSIGTECVVPGRYSEDDDHQEEEDELLSPRDSYRISGSDSFISLASISSPPMERHLLVSNTAGELSLDAMEQGETSTIVGPNNIHAGRPDFGIIFQRMQERFLQDHSLLQSEPVKVGVFYCGSPGLGQSLARECRRASTRRMKFTLTEE